MKIASRPGGVLSKKKETAPKFGLGQGVVRPPQEKKSRLWAGSFLTVALARNGLILQEIRHAVRGNARRRRDRPRFEHTARGGLHYVTKRAGGARQHKRAGTCKQ